MKTTSFKQFTTTLMLIMTMSFSSVIYAEEVALPVITKPAILQEGTQRDLTVAQIAELLPWAKNSKSLLIDLVESTQALSTDDKIERLFEGVKSVVGESAPKNSELLMRYTLNRSLILVETLNKEMDPAAVGSADVKIRVLKLSIAMALKCFDADMANLTNQKALPFATFGVDYFNFLTELNKSIFDASSQYQIQRTSLEWLQWDLYRDLNNASYAPQIVKINNSLKIFPAKKLTDSSAIKYIKQMKQITQQLDLRVVTNSIKKSNNNETVKVSDDFYSTPQREYIVGSNGYCYRTDANGKAQSSAVDKSYCTTKYRAGSNGYCYGADDRGNLLSSSAVDKSYCNSGNYSAGDNGYCYIEDAKGTLVSHSAVDKSYCINNEYRAGDNGYCYGIDKNRKMLSSGAVDKSYCTVDYRAGDNGYCYGVDKEGKMLSSGAVDKSYCIDRYTVGSNGYCYGVDKHGTMLTSSAVNRSNCSN